MTFSLQGVADSAVDQEDDALLKCLCDLAETVPKYLRPQLQNVITLCMKVRQRNSVSIVRSDLSPFLSPPPPSLFIVHRYPSISGSSPTPCFSLLFFLFIVREVISLHFCFFLFHFPSPRPLWSMNSYGACHDALSIARIGYPSIRIVR